VHHCKIHLFNSFSFSVRFVSFPPSPEKLENLPKVAISHARLQKFAEEEFGALFLNFQEVFLMNLRTTQNQQLFRTHFCRIFAEEEFGLCFSTSKKFLMNLRTSQKSVIPHALRRRRIWGLFLNFQQKFE
jgi:hypothetical protein